MSPFEPRPSPGGGYSAHSLRALDGVLLYVTLRGEHIGTYFGTTELAAAANAAADLTDTEVSA
jgi:hypothetical protein